MNPLEPDAAVHTLMAAGERAESLRRSARDWPSWSLSPSQRSALFLLLTGGLAPLTGFMIRRDYESCLSRGRLADDTFFPIPVALRVSEDFARTAQPGTSIALHDAEGVMLAVLRVDETWSCSQTGSWSLGGSVEGVEFPADHSLGSLQRGANAVRFEIGTRRWKKVMALVSSGFPHRPEFESTVRLLDEGTGLLLLPIAEMRAPDDLDYFARVRSHQAVAARYPSDRVIAALLPLASLAGQDLQATLRHVVVARNYGATHFLLTEQRFGSDGLSESDVEEVSRVAAENGLTVVRAPSVVYVAADDEYRVATASAGGAAASRIDIDDLLASGEDLPPSYTFPEVARELRRRYPPRREQGVTVFFTGLSGSGKSTIAGALAQSLMQRDHRKVTLLDGDLVRKHLTSELGFSREHRDLNIRRIGFVAAEITKHGGIAICAPIAPYDAVRQEVRRAIQSLGGFCLVFVDTPLEVCERRDRKGLYALARAGRIQNFTGISDPYEPPADADVVIRTTETSPQDAVGMILDHLEQAGYVTPRRSFDGSA